MIREEVEQVNKKIMKIEDGYDNIEYFLEMYKEGDHIHFKIKESKVHAPFTFEGDYTMEDFIKQHRAFKSCDNLDEVLEHLYTLFDNGKACLMSVGPKEEKYLYFKIWDISQEEDTQQFKLVFKMTENKDEELFTLYEIQNNQIKQLKQIKKLVEKNLSSENPLSKELLNLFEGCEIKI